MSELLVSVIIPVYNSANYLDACLDSLVMQTCNSIEIIAINDGSTDESAQILDEYAKQYPIVRVIHQENHGISETRNLGIKEAKGTYIGFVDSDDYVDVTMFEDMARKAIDEALDVVVCDYVEHVEGNQTLRVHQLPSFDKTTLKDKPNLLFDINASPWNKLYRRAFLIEHNLYFPLKVKYEDTFVLLGALLHASSIGKIDTPYVHYIVHEGSETTIMDPRVFDILEILHRVNSMYQYDSSYERYKEQLEYFNINRISVYALQQRYQSKQEVAYKFIDKAYQFLDKNFPDWKKNQPFDKANSSLKQFIKKHKGVVKFLVTVLHRR